MAYLYTCNACERGEHGKCELCTPPEPGMCGGSVCRCGCRGDADWCNWSKMSPKIHQLLMEQVSQIQSFEEQSLKDEVLKKTVVGKAKKKTPKKKK